MKTKKREKPLLLLLLVKCVLIVLFCTPSCTIEKKQTQTYRQTINDSTTQNAADVHQDFFEEKISDDYLRYNDQILIVHPILHKDSNNTIDIKADSILLRLSGTHKLKTNSNTKYSRDSIESNQKSLYQQKDSIEIAEQAKPNDKATYNVKLISIGIIIIGITFLLLIIIIFIMILYKSRQ